MITNEGIAWLQARLDGIFAEKGLCAAPKVEQYGPWTGKIVLPNGLSDDSMLEVTEKFVEHPNFAEGDNIFLGVAGEELGEEYTEEESRTFVFDLAEKSFIRITDAEVAAHRAEHVLTPRRPNRPMTNVFMPVKYQYFDMIARGMKTVESRQYNQKWVDSLLCNHLKTVTFQRGYAKGAKQMTFELVGIELADADGERRYAPEEIPPFGEPEWILVKLGERML